VAFAARHDVSMARDDQADAPFRQRAIEALQTGQGPPLTGSARRSAVAERMRRLRRVRVPIVTASKSSGMQQVPSGVCDSQRRAERATRSRCSRHAQQGSLAVPEREDRS
jgi:hypothetical protein